MTISNLAFKGNTSSNGFIDNAGTLTLNNSIVSNNIGGGIYNTGTLTLNNSIVSDNTVTRTFTGGGVDTGGGISNWGILTLNNSTVSGNTVSGINSKGGGGGGIYNGFNFLTGKDTLTLNNSTVSGNLATGDYSSGGGIYNTGTLTLNNSTVSGNTVSGIGSKGGGIYNVNGNGTYNGNSDGPIVTLNNSTVSGNRATGTDSSGGGIFIETDEQLIPITGLSIPVTIIHLTYCSLYGNTAYAGEEIAIEDALADNNGNYKPIKQVSTLTIQNSIISSNPTQVGSVIVGALISFGYNLFVNTSGAIFDLEPQTLHGTDKTLSVNDLTTLFASPVELRENGGPTKTFALAPGSPAIDQIPLAACHINGITTDQRGMKRPDGIENVCDIGALESSS